MQIVIDINETIFKRARYEYYGENEVNHSLVNEILISVMKGTVLPKGHGRLGDLDELKKEMQNYHDDCAKTSEYTRLGFETAIAVVEDADTIIKADKTESEE